MTFGLRCEVVFFSFYKEKLLEFSSMGITYMVCSCLRWQSFSCIEVFDDFVKLCFGCVVLNLAVIQILGFSLSMRLGMR